MRRYRIFLILPLGVLLGGAMRIGYAKHPTEESSTQRVVNEHPSGVPFELRRGDILVRSNWGWLPGSSSLATGEKLGHVAIVTKGATGSSQEEALNKATIIEALFYDRGLKRFELDSRKQVVERIAGISFGKEFEGFRYRLRLANLTDAQFGKMEQFLKDQLGTGYNIFSDKLVKEATETAESWRNRCRDNGWHCATLTWEAWYLSTGLDIDGNGGAKIYPNDIIASRFFDSPEGRISF